MRGEKLKIKKDNVQLHNFSTSFLTLLEKFDTIPVAMFECCICDCNSSWGILNFVATYTPPKINFTNQCSLEGNNEQNPK